MGIGQVTRKLCLGGFAIFISPFVISVLAVTPGLSQLAGLPKLTQQMLLAGISSLQQQQQQQQHQQQQHHQQLLSQQMLAHQVMQVMLYYV